MNPSAVLCSFVPSLLVFVHERLVQHLANEPLGAVRRSPEPAQRPRCWEETLETLCMDAGWSGGTPVPPVPRPVVPAALNVSALECLSNLSPGVLRTQLSTTRVHLCLCLCKPGPVPASSPSLDQRFNQLPVLAGSSHCDEGQAALQPPRPPRLEAQGFSVCSPEKQKALFSLVPELDEVFFDC